MIDNTKVYKCVCGVNGLKHVYTTDTSGKYVLMVDPHRAPLLRDATWNVSRMHRKSRLLRARATTSAPDIKLGSQLHQLVVRMRKRKRRVWAVNRNYLDARRENLLSLTYADVRMLASSRPSTKAVGVRRGVQPKWMKTCFRPYSAHIGIEGKSQYLGAFASLEEAQSAYDAAAIKCHGPDATTNQSLGLLSIEVAKTKLCRRAARAARNVVKDYWSGELAKKYKALLKAKSRKKQLEIFASVRAVDKPVPGPRVEVAGFAAVGA